MGEVTHRLIPFVVHKIVHGKVPSFLSEVLPQTVGNNTQYCLRNKDNLTQIPCRTEKFRKSFFPDAIWLWNKLDHSVRSIDEMSEFKTHIPDVNKKSPTLYNYGSRTLNVIQAQLRLQCSNLKSHLSSLHVTDDPQCICTTGNEDCLHFCFECPLYLEQRQQLSITVMQLSRFVLYVFLFGVGSVDLNTNQQIFAAVQKYNKDSNRF